jgi:hypothetical protein
LPFGLRYQLAFDATLTAAVLDVFIRSVFAGCLRHTYASLLLADGAPLTYVGAQLGPRQPDHHPSSLCAVDAQEGKRWINALDKTSSGGRFGHDPFGLRPHP